MAQAKFLPFKVNGRVLKLLFEKYPDSHVSPTPYHSLEIRSDMVVLPSGQTVATFKESALTEFRLQTGPKFLKQVNLQNQASQRLFHKPYEATLQQEKAILRLRYTSASASTDHEYKVFELRECARQGHVQASLDLGMLLDAEGNIECVDYFVQAHDLGHSESLLCLSKTFFKTGQTVDAVRVLLLGAWCGSIRCAQLLLVIREHRLHIFEVPECMSALEESRAYGSIHAKFFLGFVLRHSEIRRDEERGRALMIEASEVRHFRADNGKRTSLINGTKQNAAGTLAHFEVLIDRELLAIRTEELKPEFLAKVVKLPAGAGDETRAAFAELLNEFNPVPGRMTRLVANWLENGQDEPVDQAKLERMQALLEEYDEHQASKGAGHE